MAEYIEREALKEKFWGACKNCLSEDDIADLIDDVPAADVATVVHGKWLKEVYRDPYGADWTRYVCSLCGRIEIKKEPYCNCGAKMDGGKANE